jgi:glycosyltransferase involved in cell wall biosynthesis
MTFRGTTREPTRSPAALSVVVPVYNAEAWVAETLRSVFAQTVSRDRLELVVVDDGSADGSIGIIQDLLRAAPVPSRLLQTPGNSGPSRARNIGWQSATGRWVQFLDADDVLHPKKLATQGEVASREPEDVAVVYSPWTELHCRHGEWEAFQPAFSPVVGPDAVVDLLRDENTMVTGVPLFSRTWLERVGGWDERHRLIEDNDLMLRIAMAGGRFAAAPSPEPLFYYRHTPDSLSKGKRQAFVEGCLRNVAMVETYWRETSGLTVNRARVLAEGYYRATRYYADVCPRRFSELSDKLDELTGRFTPSGPWHMRLASRLIGYRRTELLASRYRGFKRWLRRQAEVVRPAKG